MRRIEEDVQGPIEITGAVTILSTVTGDVTVAENAELRLTGEVAGSITVRAKGALVLIGRVKGAVVNEGGAVDIFGFVGRASDVGTTETYVSRGAIIGGKRASRPSRLSRFPG
jgi:cytoskeletal protein CcmA (bactofilin family)